MSLLHLHVAVVIVLVHPLALVVLYGAVPKIINQSGSSMLHTV